MIQVKQLSYTYPKAAMPSIKGIDFDIHRGEIFGFLGPSGAGKSTTQKVLFKLLHGYTGQARVEGREVREWGRELYHKIGVCFELPNHYLKLSALENLQFFGAFYNRQYRSPLALLELVGLGKDAHKPVSDFSKGMKMRLNVVRAMLHDPDILFLDEPTSGLDPVNARLIKDLIIQLRQAGKTIFITTHQMHDADELCDTVAFMVNGEIKAIDSPQQLKLKYSKRRVAVKTAGQVNNQMFDLEGLGQNEAFLQCIRSQSIETIHSQEASLEDIFIQITGQQLHE